MSELIIKSKAQKFDGVTAALTANFEGTDIGNITFIKLSENSYGTEAC